jgi:hypothetical protein
VRIKRRTAVQLFSFLLLTPCRVRVLSSIHSPRELESALRVQGNTRFFLERQLNEPLTVGIVEISGTYDHPHALSSV